MTLQHIITHDEADWLILKLANDKRKFALQLALDLDLDTQNAFERGIDNDWWTLVDISPLANTPLPVIMRVFKLTPAGWDRRNELALMFKESL